MSLSAQVWCKKGPMSSSVFHAHRRKSTNQKCILCSLDTLTSSVVFFLFLFFWKENESVFIADSSVVF